MHLTKDKEVFLKEMAVMGIHDGEWLGVFIEDWDKPAHISFLSPHYGDGDIYTIKVFEKQLCLDPESAYEFTYMQAAKGVPKPSMTGLCNMDGAVWWMTHKSDKPATFGVSMGRGALRDMDILKERLSELKKQAFTPTLIMMPRRNTL